MFLPWYLNILMNVILEKYFNDTDCLMHVYDSKTASLYLSAPHYLTEGVDNFHLDSKERCRHFILQCEDAGYAFRKVEDIIKYDSEGMYNNRNYIIIISNSEAFEDLFNSTILTFIRDILVIYVGKEDISIGTENKIIQEDDGVVFSLFTHQYVGLESNNDPMLLDIWYAENQSFYYGNNLYPDKVFNQMGRGLRIGCVNSLPFSNCNFDLESHEELGNEHHVVLRYAKIYNYTLKPFLNDTDGGLLYPNWTGYGIREKLIKDEGHYDVVYGGFPTGFNVDMLRSVRYTYEVSVPVPMIKYGWLWVFNIFQTSIWVLLFLAFSSTYLVFQLRRILIKHEYSYGSEIRTISIFGLFINQSSPPSKEVRKSFVLKFMCLVILFSSILLCAWYNSRLSSVMVIPMYEHDIKTLEECANSDYKLLFFDEYYSIMAKDTRQIYRKLYNKIYLLEHYNETTYNFPKSEILLSSRKYAVARYRRSTIGYFEDDELLKQMYGKYKPITPELFTDYYYFLLRKNSMHTMELAKVLDAAVESGLMTFWEQDGLRFQGNMTFQWKIHDFKMDNANQNLNMKNLKGCFGFWFICMILSTLVFIREVFSKRYKNTILCCF